jgi:hypothetical protein
MRNAGIRRPSNKGLLGKASSTRVARRPTNMTVMPPANQAELSRWYHDKEYRRDGRPIPRPVEIHHHHTDAEKSDWTNVMGVAGGTFAAAMMGLMLLPSLLTAFVLAILFLVLGSLVAAFAVSTFRGSSLGTLLFPRTPDPERGHAQSRS